MSFQNIIDAAPETAEFDILSHANESGKFCVPLGGGLSQHQQDALERLMLRDWVRLIDVSAVPTCGMPGLVRVFLAMPAAMTWYRERAAS